MLKICPISHLNALCPDDRVQLLVDGLGRMYVAVNRLILCDDNLQIQKLNE
jgi:hypothetical protein